MIDKTETRSIPVGLKFTPTLKNALDKAAAADHRSVASYVEKVLIDHLKAAGHLKAKPKG